MWGPGLKRRVEETLGCCPWAAKSGSIGFVLSTVILRATTDFMWRLQLSSSNYSKGGSEFPLLYFKWKSYCLLYSKALVVQGGSILPSGGSEQWVQGDSIPLTSPGGSEHLVQGGSEQWVQGGSQQWVQGGSQQWVQGGSEQWVQGGSLPHPGGSEQWVQGGSRLHPAGSEQWVHSNVHPVFCAPWLDPHCFCSTSSCNASPATQILTYQWCSVWGGTWVQMNPPLNKAPLYSQWRCSIDFWEHFYFLSCLEF